MGESQHGNAAAGDDETIRHYLDRTGDTAGVIYDSVADKYSGVCTQSYYWTLAWQMGRSQNKQRGLGKGTC